MQLAVWTYEGPPHVGAMRVATAMRGVHFVLHAPQGDTYADLLFTMIERRDARPPVTYTTFQARDLGGDTAELFKNAARGAYERFQPQAMLVGASCTAELIQDDPGGLAEALRLPIPVIPLELPSYQRKEHWGASETFFRIVQALAPRERPARAPGRPSANLLGPCALGFRHRDDVVEISRLLDTLGIDVNVVAPLGASPADIARLGEADFNILLYPEIGPRPRAGWSAATARNGPHRPDRRRRHARLHRRSVSDRRRGRHARRDRAAAALVEPLGRFDLSHGQARLHLRRRYPRNRRRPRRAGRARFRGRGPWLLQSRIRP
jgi:light-independent protochlorophyllide reductase subunit B